MEIFGSNVFMDIDEIRVGDTWSETLHEALDSARILLVVIGPSWLRLADAYGRRRLDIDDDWVSAEIECSINRNIGVIPVLVNRGTMPPKEALPRKIEALVNQQYLELRENHWKTDLQVLIDRLMMPPWNLKRQGERVSVPIWPNGLPNILHRSLDDAEIQRRLSAMQHWRLSVSPLPGEYPRNRLEITRQYKFCSFEKAIDFMKAAVPHINAANHHPRWENLFKTVTVWLSTWDSGHVITSLDFDLAIHFDNLFAEFEDSTVK